jgi:hypothetical protein
VDQKKYKLTRRMLPILMKPLTLLVLTGVCIVGEVMWVYLGIRNGNQWECVVLFVVGSLIGFIGGGRTSKLWDEYYIEAILRRVKLMKTPMGRRNAIFIFTALGVPMALSFIPTSLDPFLPVLQSYIFGFICGMNIAIYQWAKKLPKQ